MLSENVRSKTTLTEYVVIPWHDISKWFCYSSKHAVVMSGKKLPGILKLPKVSTYIVARFRT